MYLVKLKDNELGDSIQVKLIQLTRYWGKQNRMRVLKGKEGKA